MTAVVVADDDPRDRARTAAALRLAGYRVRVARSSTHAGALLRRSDVAAVIVDPTVEAAPTTVAALRARTKVPIIVTSASVHEWDKVAVLDAGADDYLSKPFGVEELLARLRAIFRRVVEDGRVDIAPIVTADFVVHLADRRLVRTDGAEVHLTRVEWRLVEELARRRGHLVPHDELLLAVWGPSAVEKPGNIRVNMAHIRAKLEPEPGRPRYFLTAPGLGLRFDPTGGRP